MYNTQEINLQWLFNYSGTGNWEYLGYVACPRMILTELKIGSP